MDSNQIQRSKPSTVNFWEIIKIIVCSNLNIYPNTLSNTKKLRTIFESLCKTIFSIRCFGITTKQLSFVK
jgi:hypothetical protein